MTVYSSTGIAASSFLSRYRQWKDPSRPIIQDSEMMVLGKWLSRRNKLESLNSASYCEHSTLICGGGTCRSCTRWHVARVQSVSSAAPGFRFRYVKRPHPSNFRSPTPNSFLICSMAQRQQSCSAVVISLWDGLPLSVAYCTGHNIHSHITRAT